MMNAKSSSRAELQRRLREKIQFARSQRTRGKPAEVPDDTENNNNDDDSSDIGGPSTTATDEDGKATDAGAAKSASAQRRAKKKRERRRQRKLAKAYDRGGMNGMMDAMGVKDPTIRDAVHRIAGSSGSGSLRPGSGVPTQETVDGLIGRFQSMAGSTPAPTTPASTDGVNERPLLEDISDD